MSEPEESRPSEVELAILHVLWERGPSTVREVHERVGKARKTGYTTVLKLMQIMATKGMVERDESRRSHVYRASIERARTQRRLVADLLDRVFQGSGRDLVMQALAARRASPGDIAEIRSLLDELEKEGGTDESDAGGDA
jgi:BlaI family transcriptional regulator, penicillinase repressor